MKKFFRVGAWLTAGAVLLVTGGVGYLLLGLPPRFSVPEVKLPTSAGSLENGRYLANHVAVCIECHSVRNHNLFAGPVEEQSLGQGGEAFPGDFGVLYAPNITPEALGSWSNEDIYRAIVTGVRPDGSALFPLMPYPHYSQMDPRDVEDIIAYVRGLTSRSGKSGQTELNFPFNLIVRTMPLPAAPKPRPAVGTREYGSYLTNMASCTDCHTPMDKGAPVPGLSFAGGREFPVPSGVTRSANITPDKETGIGRWSREAFIARFKDPKAAHNVDSPLAPGQVNTIMPWRSYAGMTADDLGAIYDHLMLQPAVKNRVQHYGPAAKP